jgi:hypothetical protein
MELKYMETAKILYCEDQTASKARISREKNAVTCLTVIVSPATIRLLKICIAAI